VAPPPFHRQRVLPFTRALVSSLAITSLPRTVAAICSAVSPNGLPKNLSFNNGSNQRNDSGMGN
jgi:hypothetical protein